MITSPMTTIAIIAPIPKPVTIVSVIDAGGSVGGGVTDASSTFMAVSA